MKVLYIHQYFRTPNEGGSIRSYTLAKELVKNGYNVEIITSHNHTTSETKIIEGITVHYLPIPYNNNYGYIKRLRAFGIFTFLAILKSHEINGVALCYVMTTPLTTGFIGLYNKWFRNTPYIFEIGDLWPEVPIQMKVINNPILKWTLYKLEKLFYNQSIGIIALSTDIASYISKIVPYKPIEIIPNISDCDFFKPDIKDEREKSKYNISDEFVISYTGTIGKANHLEYLIDIALASKHLNILYLIIGDGSEKEKIQYLSKRHSLKNLRFLPSTDKKGIKSILNISDAIYLSFKDISILHTGSPNKFFDGLSAGKMVVSNLGGWTKEIIEKEQIGIYYNPNKPLEFVKKITPFFKNQAKQSTVQYNARKLAENKFSINILSQKQFDFIDKLT